MLTPMKLDKIRTDIKLALSMVESTHDLQFEIGKITYSSYSFSCKLEAALAKDGEEANLEKTLWDRDYFTFGFNKNDFGKQFKSNGGDIYTISGVRSRRTKYPIMGTNSEGRKFKFTARAVKRGLI